MKGHKKKQMPGGLPHRRNKNIDFVPTLNKKQITLAVLNMNLQPSFNGEQKSQVKFKALRPKMKNNEKFLPEGQIMKI